MGGKTPQLDRRFVRKMDGGVAAGAMGFIASIVVETFAYVKTRQKNVFQLRMMEQGIDIDDSRNKSDPRSHAEGLVYFINSTSATIISYLILFVYIADKAHGIFVVQTPVFNDLDKNAFITVIAYQLGMSTLKKR